MSRTLPRGSRGNRTIVMVARFRELGILVFLAVFMLAATTQSPNFLTGDNLSNIVVDTSLLVIVAVAETTVILARQLDLSVGSMLGVCALSVGFILKANPGMPLIVALLLGIVIGALLGTVNGLIIAVGRVPAIIATLGTLSIYRGVNYVIAGTAQVNPEDLPQSLMDLTRTSPVGVPWLVLFAGVVALVIGVALRSTRPGRAVYAIGSNPAAAALRGVRVSRLVFGMFVLCGALCGLAGVLYAGRYGTVNPDAGDGVELQAIAAVVVGGTNLFGGSGSVLGTVLGCLLLGTITNALAILNLSEYWQEAVYGVFILAAVMTDSTIRERMQKALKGARL